MTLLTLPGISYAKVEKLKIVAVEKPKIVVLMKGLMGVDYQLLNATRDLSQYEWVIVTETLTSSDLEGASVLIIVMVDSSMTVEDDEITVIKNWLAKGNKMLWVSGDSDYGNDYPRQLTANKVLEAIGSKLRVDLAEAVDTKSNGGKPYRVLALSDNCDEEVKFLVAGVHRALFHGPGAIIAYVNGEYVKLNEKKVENVYRLMWTSDGGMISEFNPPTSKVYVAGEEGRFVILAIEVDPAKKNIIVVSGDAPFDHYTGTYKPELKRYTRYAIEYPQQGAILFSNLMYWGTHTDEFFKMLEYPKEVSRLKEEVSTLEGQVSSLKGQVSSLQGEVSTLQSKVKSLEGELGAARAMQTTYLAGGLIIGLIIGFAVAFFLFKKK